MFLGDYELIRYVQRIVGYTAVGETTESVLLIPYGSGANGKSVFIELIHDLLGDYAKKTPIETLVDRRSGGIPNDIARLQGARMVSASETDIGGRLAEGTVKAMTGGDKLIARELYKPWFEFQPAFTPWLTTNHLPEIRGTDHGIWRRIRVIPFRATFTEEQQDKTLGAKLRAELPGILNWLVDGVRDWMARGGLDEPPSVRAATNEYRTDLDTVGLWIDECCDTGPTQWATSKRLHQSYSEWAEGYGADQLSDKQLGARLAEKGFPGKRKSIDGRQQRVRLGVTLRLTSPPLGTEYRSEGRGWDDG